MAAAYLMVPPAVTTNRAGEMVRNREKSGKSPFPGFCLTQRQDVGSMESVWGQPQILTVSMPFVYFSSDTSVAAVRYHPLPAGCTSGGRHRRHDAIGGHVVPRSGRQHLE